MKEAGGILLAIKFLPGLILLPISQHKMIMTASKELYLIKKSDAKMFREDLNDTKHQKSEFHYGASYSCLTSFQIFLMG